MVARLAPLEPPYDEVIARTFERMMGAADVEPLVLFRTVAHNPHLLDKLRSTGSYLLNFGTLEPIEREIVILRTCARCGSEYEWGVHVALFAPAVGLSDRQVAATVIADDAAWTPRQSLLVRLVDELHDDHAVSDDLWESLDAVWSAPQLVELVTLVGQYHAISFVTNAFALPLEPFGARFPR
jgi:4-carboxymuconolactone decarboxylase